MTSSSVANNGQVRIRKADAAGIREMIFITGRNKRAIEDHFDTAYELEAELAAGAKQELLAAVQSVKPYDMECFYVRQPLALGLGHAVLCAEKLVRGEPFAVLLADDLMVGSPPVMKQMVASEPVLAYRYEGTRYDCGSKLGFLQANMVLGAQHTEEGNASSEWLQTHDASVAEVLA